LLFLAGCSTEGTSPKTSHFEHDHEVAAHWPSDLADAATKIRDRLIWLKDGRVPESHEDDDDHGHDHDHENDPWAEIVEIVSWIPEIAADTNLSEADWLQLYHASESLLGNLQSADGKLTGNNLQQLESLCELVDDAATRIPEQPAPLAEANS